MTGCVNQVLTHRHVSYVFCGKWKRQGTSFHREVKSGSRGSEQFSDRLVKAWALLASSTGEQAGLSPLHLLSDTRGKWREKGAPQTRAQQTAAPRAGCFASYLLSFLVYKRDEVAVGIKENKHSAEQRESNWQVVIIFIIRLQNSKPKDTKRSFQSWWKFYQMLPMNGPSAAPGTAWIAG